MTPLRLTSWFRARMLPLVAATAVVVATAAPGAFYLRERWDLVNGARGHAGRIGEALRGEIDGRPTLWRYDSTKLAERLAGSGLDRAAIRLVDAEGIPVAVESAPLPARPLWGRVEVLIDGRREATVWVAADHGALLVSAGELAAAFALLALGLAAVLYLLPVRAIGRAERRIGLLLGRLTLTLQEEDRRRIARDLHDGAGQAITAARLELLALRARGVDPEAAQRIAHLLDEALEEVRRSTAALVPPALAELGLARALVRHCEAFGDAAGLAVECRVAEELPSLPAEVETACYRIVQEALANTARHAGATRAWVRLAQVAGGRLRLEIGDDGGGIVGTSRRADPGGQGIEGIRERVRLLDGEVALESHEGSGLRIEITLPIRLSQ
ncbi:MAG: sensor histidine kinase [Myxococcales bacterium]|nr:sensor histidine kinase [Myxococcales bacterium]